MTHVVVFKFGIRSVERDHFWQVSWVLLVLEVSDVHAVDERGIEKIIEAIGRSGRTMHAILAWHLGTIFVDVSILMEGVKLVEIECPL